MSRQSVHWSVPLSTRTTANARKGAGANRWATHERNTKEKDDITIAAPKARLLALPHPVVVTLVRTHPPGHALDEHDNLRAALKAVVDAVTPLLGLKSDRDERVAWRYRQRQGGKNEWGVHVEVVGPCRLVEAVVDVPEGHDAPFVEGQIHWASPDAASWAKQFESAIEDPDDHAARALADNRGVPGSNDDDVAMTGRRDGEP